MSIYAYRNPNDGSPMLGYTLPAWEGSRVERCFIDAEALNALNTLIVGPVESPETIVRTESAIRALLFHDAVHLIRPSVKRYYHSSADHDPFIGSKFIGDDLDTSGIQSVLTDANYHEELGTIDHIVAFGNEELERAYVAEAQRKGYVELTDTTVQPPRRGRAPANILQVGSDEDDYYRNTFQTTEELIKNFLVPIPKSGLLAYLTNPTYADYQSRITEQRDGPFFEAFDKSWAENSGRIQDYLNMPMEPLIAILLHRANSRDEIPEELINLRQEFADARQQFWEFVDDVSMRTLPPTLGWRRLDELQEQAGEIIPKGLYSKHDGWQINIMWIARLVWLVNTGQFQGAAELVAEEAMKMATEMFTGPMNYVDMAPLLEEQISKIDWETLAPKHFSDAELAILGDFL